jgi:hypothetical protein
MVALRDLSEQRAGRPDRRFMVRVEQVSDTAYVRCRAIAAA